MKKKVQVVKNLKTKDELHKYLSPSYDKVVVVNIYDEFWGACEVAEPLIKRFKDDSPIAEKAEWISVEKGIGSELMTKAVFGSKPKYYVYVKGELFATIDGIDYPSLIEEVNRGVNKLEVGMEK